jgi:hypothetical protein
MCWFVNVLFYRFYVANCLLCVFFLHLAVTFEVNKCRGNRENKCHDLAKVTSD